MPQRMDRNTVASASDRSALSEISGRHFVTAGSRTFCKRLHHTLGTPETDGRVEGTEVQYSHSEVGLFKSMNYRA